MLKALTLLGLAFLLLIAVLLFNTARFTLPSAPKVNKNRNDFDEESAAGRLAGALRFATVSNEDPDKVDWKVFEQFRAYLQQTFPRVHQTLQREVVNEHSLLFTWIGRDPALRPVLLMAHQDVVPAGSGNDTEWDHPPFSGEIAEGYIWGRGALDDKASLTGILEAVELLLAQGFEPQRTIYLAFGHDEEVGGFNGAARIAEMLQSRGERLELVLDEGGMIVEGVLPNIAVPVALVGTAEKGYLTLGLSVQGKAGHSSMPEASTAIGVLSRAITRLESRPFPADLSHTRRLFSHLSNRLPFSKRLVLANLWLFGPLVEKHMTAAPETNATIRTTAAATVMSGGVKENILPASASALVNLRIMPGESVDLVTRQVEKIIADPRVAIRPQEVRSEPSPVSDPDTQIYALLNRTIRQAAGEQELPVAPYLEVAATDSRHYSELTSNTLRYVHFPLNRQDLARLHGLNERISVKDYAGVVRFYLQLLKNLQTSW